MTMRIATAEWANPDEVEERYLYHDGTIWLGRSASEHQTPLGYRDDRHVCLVGGSRGGKGTTGIIPTLVTWPGSICVVDPKGENATITAARRGGGSQHAKGMGQSVKVLDPFQSAQVDDGLRGRFNPLDALDPQNEETIDEAGRIADAIVVIHEGSNDPFWDESARAMVKGLILHVLTAPQYEGRRNLITLRKLITRGDWETIETLRDAGEKDIPPAHGLLWTGLANNQAFDGLVAGIGDSFTNMLLNSPKQFESVLQVANRNTEFIDSPAMQRLLGASDFQLSELKTRPEGLSLYLCLPQRYMSTHYRWLRMMIALTVTEMEKVRGKPATGHPVLLVLDEFAGLKRMEVIEHAVAQIAGYGVKMFFVLQSLEQLKGAYKENWETFLANSGLKVFFNLEDNFSRDYVSKLIGETEVIREVRSGSEGVSESESVSHSTSESRSESTSRSTSRGTSESRGRSDSIGTSENEGTNSSTSTGKSWGINSSRSRSQNYTYAQGIIFRRYDDERIGDSRTQSEGESKGWTKGESHGVSHGTSRSKTGGTSETSGTSISETDGTTYGTSTSETEGTTRGTSQSRTSGASETIHKRALVTPDEIGQVFSRIDERAHPAYPGLALVVISGARPVALRRVNYFEDFQFMGLFDPHPDHPMIEPRDLFVASSDMGEYEKFFIKHVNTGSWLIKAGDAVATGQPVLPLRFGKEPFGYIRSPLAGKIRGVAQKPAEGGDLFVLQYFEGGAAAIDPFADVAARGEKYRNGLFATIDKIKGSVDRYVWPGLGFILLIIMGLAGLGTVVTMIGVAGMALCGWKIYGKYQNMKVLYAALVENGFGTEKGSLPALPEKKKQSATRQLYEKL
jgi:type IV secretory pathway TraG/TraD family ATPase VirD4